MPDLATQIIMICIWFGLLVFFIAIELETVQLVSIWFAGGALVALILAGFDVAIVYQLLAFALVAMILILCVKIFFPKLGFMKSRDYSDSYKNPLIGKTITVTKRIDERALGEGRINDINWMLFTENNEIIEAGQKVLICDISGNRLLVKSLPKGGK